MKLVISMVPVTDTPYAVARAVELPNPTTVAITASISIQLIEGM